MNFTILLPYGITADTLKDLQNSEKGSFNNVVHYKNCLGF